MRTAMWLLCCAFLMLSCAHRTQPIYDAEISIPNTVKVENIPRAIKSALVEGGWTIQSEKENVIESKILVRSHSAEIRIPFDNDFIKIQYIDSDNYLYNKEGNTQHIHRNYNRLIKLLERDISHNLALLQ